MTSTSLLERLANHRKLCSAPRGEIEWLAAHGHLKQLMQGEAVSSRTGLVDALYVVLSGHLTIYVDRGAGRRKFMEWVAGDVTGLLPYSRLKDPPGNVEIEETSDVFILDREYLPALIRDCPEITTILVHEMLDRARIFNSNDLHDHKLMSLGTLTASIAHELNNPVSAISRSAGSFGAILAAVETSSRALGGLGLTPSQFAAIEDVRKLSVVKPNPNIRSPLEQEDRERTLANWLKQHQANSKIAESLAETDVTTAMLDRLAVSLSGETLDKALCWIAADFSARRLASEIQTASIRVSELVASMKEFTQLDRVAVPEPVDIQRGIENTVRVLGSKARMKAVGITLNLDPDLSKVEAFASELNQIWSNLIDNAIDAVAEGGKVDVIAQHDGRWVVVRVIDNGSGINAEIRDRIYDPFFTTKEVGKGTGLGLDIVRRLVQRYNGRIDLDSRTGRTEFKVRLPAAIPPKANS